jgi:hypothetical protein
MLASDLRDIQQTDKWINVNDQWTCVIKKKKDIRGKEMQKESIIGSTGKRVD